MQTILGGGGAIGTELAKSLSDFTNKVRIVSRNPKKVNENDELMSADLSNREHVFKAVEGSEVVYVTIGFDYNHRTWKEKWPAFMQNVIDACKKYHAKLVFFDNVYMYDSNHLVNMTEETPVNPVSKKGKVRAQVAEMITDEFGKGQIMALIARSADFYGPRNDKSALVITVFDNFKKGKKANWFARVDKLHNYTYTPDAAKATAILGNTPDAFNQVWHLPTASTKLTGRQWIELIAKEMNMKPKFMVMPVWLMGIIGIFVPIIRELKEMTYQYDRDYFFNSSKFENKFNFKPTSPVDGIRETLKNMQNNL
jgi:nucleoside-diphosphate-sugar epimerase